MLYLSCRQFVVALFPLVTFVIPALLLGFSSSLMSLFESCFGDMFNHKEFLTPDWKLLPTVS